MAKVIQCRCTFIRHPSPQERVQWEAEKAILERIAIEHASWATRTAAKREAAILYLALHTECLTQNEAET